MEKKLCKKCSEIKEVQDFYKHKAVCKECHLKQNKEYRIINKIAISEKSKKWYDKTKNERKAHKAEYYRNRRKNDKIFAVKTSISRLIRVSISRCGFKKTSRTHEILGCSFEEFKIYLESKFETWMNWGNKGLYNGELNFGWDIDHIIPISSANSEEDVIRLNHYSNLQPLCSKVNRDLKRNK
jgi:hypothetical protein